MSTKRKKDAINLNSKFSEAAKSEDSGPQKVPKDEKMKKTFEYTKPSRDELRFQRTKMTFKLLCLGYLLVVVALAVFLQEYLILLALLLLFNVMLVFWVGTAAIRSLVFPYSLWLISDGVSSQNSRRYSLDFAGLLEKCYVILRMQGMGEGQDAKVKGGEPAPALEQINNKAAFENLRTQYSVREVNSKLRSLQELVALYADTNSKVFERAEREGTIQKLPQELKDATKVLCRMLALFGELQLNVRHPWGHTKLTSLSSHYQSESTSFQPDRRIQVVDSSSNKALLDEMEELVLEFRGIVTRANAPISCGCCRLNCCGFKFVNVFHSDDQLEQMLEKNFDGRRFTVKAQDGTELDCMFFPFSEEQVQTVAEMKASKQVDVTDPEKRNNLERQPDYLGYPTIIFFNPNAQCYQQQVHAPNAFWLKFFVSNEVNVMAWNYRSYGRSKGTPDPYTSYHDGESVLKFIIEELGLQGKIGCFGRSLGGTMATHLARHYPQYIDFLFVDRSLGSLKKMSESSFLGQWTPSIFANFSQHWVVSSDENFLNSKCFKMLTQDPWDNTVDQFCALNAQVARVACNDRLGAARFDDLKTQKAYTAMRLLFSLESQLCMQLRFTSRKVAKEVDKDRGKKKGQAKRKLQYQAPAQEQDQNANNSSEYPREIEEEDDASPAGPAVQLKELQEKENNSQSQKSAGYSTDVDQLARAKRLLALERSWLQQAASRELNQHKLNQLVLSSTKENTKQCERISSSLTKVLVFLNDLHGGLIRLGWVCSPNSLYKIENFELFIDNLFAYGCGYSPLTDANGIPSEPYQPRKQRLAAISEVNTILRVIRQAKKEIKDSKCFREEESLTHLVLACLTIAAKFFENIKNQMQRQEVRGNLTPSQLGHLVPLTVGHRDSPIDPEVKYIKQIWRLANFLKDNEESLESGVNLCGNPPGAASWYNNGDYNNNDANSPSPVNESKIELQLQESQVHPLQTAGSNRGEKKIQNLQDQALVLQLQQSEQLRSQLRKTTSESGRAVGRRKATNDRSTGAGSVKKDSEHSRVEYGANEDPNEIAVQKQIELEAEDQVKKLQAKMRLRKASQKERSQEQNDQACSNQSPELELQIPRGTSEAAELEPSLKEVPEKVEEAQEDYIINPHQNVYSSIQQSLFCLILYSEIFQRLTDQKQDHSQEANPSSSELKTNEVAVINSPRRQGYGLKQEEPAPNSRAAQERVSAPSDSEEDKQALDHDEIELDLKIE